ncbi:MAG: zinc ribbon domain-containing protein [Phormidium sp. GEM2.Bin31]|nr:zinc ribbon domain-containing protein [Phormidium sp. BM_Day4_Bin.17]TVR15079.1 MAG: zinc ribbon domain-containing protein [Phormidium sp. GEM2.Bin31]UCJ11220.1 MAG: zinc ribbon domain-containing protein [Phormidium sp. PBR-2020]
MPLYEYRCPQCGEFEAWRTIASRDQAPACPDCNGPSARIFAAPMVNLNTGNLGRFTGSSDPKLVTRQREPNAPRYQPSQCDRPWMLGHAKY